MRLFYNRSTVINNVVCDLQVHVEKINGMFVAQPGQSIGFSQNKWKAAYKREAPIPVTGNVGIKGLLWAKKEIVAFIESMNIPVLVTAQDGCPKRLGAYMKLMDIGFRPVVIIYKPEETDNRFLKVGQIKKFQCIEDAGHVFANSPEHIGFLHCSMEAANQLAYW